jgi:hypothetical protein
MAFIPGFTVAGVSIDVGSAATLFDASVSRPAATSKCEARRYECVAGSAIRNVGGGEYDRKSSPQRY